MRVTYERERICRMWVGSRPVVACFTAQSVEAILSSNVNIEKSVEYEFTSPWLGHGLITSPQNKWRRRRKILTPAFHFRILNDFLPVINEQAAVLVGKIAEYRGSSLDFVPLSCHCALDVICETTMGINIRSQSGGNSKYVRTVSQAAELVLLRVMRPWLWPDFIFYLSKHGRRFKGCLTVLKAFTLGVIEERKRSWERILGDQDLAELAAEQISERQLYERLTSSRREDCDQDDDGQNKNGRLTFLDILLYEHMVRKTLTLSDVREEVDTFMFAGHDTTSMSISWTIYLLGLDEAIQERARQEVDQVFESCPDQQTLGMDQVKNLKYVEQCIKEAQRVYPSVPFIGRELVEDTLISGYLVPKGTTCAVFTHLLHRDERVWPQPAVYNPDRFSPEASVGRNPFAFVPFSAGPRNCIGQRLALMELKIVIANLLRHYRFTSLEARDKLLLVGEMILRPRNGLKIRFTSRRDLPSKS